MTTNIKLYSHQCNQALKLSYSKGNYQSLPLRLFESVFNNVLLEYGGYPMFFLLLTTLADLPDTSHGPKDCSDSPESKYSIPSLDLALWDL